MTRLNFNVELSKKWHEIKHKLALFTGAQPILGSQNKA